MLPIMVFNLLLDMVYQFFPPLRSHTTKAFVHKPLHVCQGEPAVVIPHIALYLCPCHFNWIDFAMSNWKPDNFMSYEKTLTLIYGSNAFSINNAQPYQPEKQLHQ